MVLDENYYISKMFQKKINISYIIESTGESKSGQKI